MKELQLQIEINAGREKVWDTLWRNETFQQWAGMIDLGTHMVGELKEGGEIQFISANGYGVASLVEEYVPGELLLLRHRADTREGGKRERAKQWTGGQESYRLVEKDGVTTLTVTADVPSELLEELTVSYPRALERIKLLAEK